MTDSLATAWWTICLCGKFSHKTSPFVIFRSLFLPFLPECFLFSPPRFSEVPLAAGTYLANSPLQNFGEFYQEVCMNPETWRFEGGNKEFRNGLTGRSSTNDRVDLIASFGHKKFSQVTHGRHGTLHG